MPFPKICPAPSRQAADQLAQFRDAARPDAFSVATWNINRLPFAKQKNRNYRVGREYCQSKLLGAFTINAVQERFMPLPPVFGHRATENTLRPRVDTKGLRSTHHGLAFISEAPMRTVSEGHFTRCGPNLGDCMARKGWIAIEVSTPTGPVIIVTTHMDAGRQARDRVARTSQIDELMRALEPFADRPMILMGDLNLTTTDAADQALLQVLLGRLNLTVRERQAGKGHDVLATRGVDVLGTLQYNDPTLTDHPLIAARVRVTPER
jgi:endonuclease/exonuclease/phosphatase family metal-dependent hydrolase